LTFANEQRQMIQERDKRLGSPQRQEAMEEFF